MSQADFGRLEIEMAEAEMPGLMACRAEFGAKQPFKGARASLPPSTCPCPASPRACIISIFSIHL